MAQMVSIPTYITDPPVRLIGAPDRCRFADLCQERRGRILRRRFDAYFSARENKTLLPGLSMSFLKREDVNTLSECDV